MTLALSVGLLLLFDGVYAIARDAVGEHRNCAVQFRLDEQPIRLEEAAAHYAAWYGLLQGQPSTELTTHAGPIRVLERHAYVFNGRRFAHIVLRFQGHVVSLLVTDDRNWVPDLTRGKERPRLASRVMADGLGVVSFRASSHLVFFVSTLSEPELRQITEALAGPLARRLAGA